MSNEKRQFIVELEDSLIMDENPDGSEKLRLQVKSNGKSINIRFPKYNDFDSYIDHMQVLLIRLSYVGADLQTDVENADFTTWAKIASEALKLKKIKNLVEKIFFKYLRPEVAGFWNWHPILKRIYCKRYLNIDILIQMLIACFHVENWIKKKTTSMLNQMFQRATSQPFTLASKKKPVGHQSKLDKNQHSKSGLSFDV